MTASFSDLRVLLVDDNTHMRTIVSTILKGLGVREIVEAGDGSHALRQLKTWRADIAFVDFLMHPMDGVEFTRLVRTTSITPFLPIIMMTGHAEKARVSEARDAGVTEFLVKPVTAKGVIDRLNAVIFKPRPFIKADSYIGPNRRRVAGAPITGERRADLLSRNNVTEI
jgi:two-component system chemotaxis response regulator CheY